MVNRFTRNEKHLCIFYNSKKVDQTVSNFLWSYKKSANAITNDDYDMTVGMGMTMRMLMSRAQVKTLPF